MSSDTLVYRTLPTPKASDATARTRGTRYGEAIDSPLWGGKMTQHADEGAYFVAANATALTGITASIATAYVATTPYIMIKNGDSAGATARRLFLDYIRLLCTVAPASATASHAAIEIDDSSARYTSGGTSLTPVCCNMDQSASPGADLVYVGAITAAAAGANRRIVGRQVVRAQIGVIKDVTIFDFGSGSKGASSQGVITSVQTTVLPCAPIVLGPGQWFLLNLFHPSNATTGADYEVEIGYVKR